jgi:hypothetical protein
MAPASQAEMLARLRATFDLYDLAEKVMRQNLRRRHLTVHTLDLIAHRGFDRGKDLQVEFSRLKD